MRHTLKLVQITQTSMFTRHTCDNWLLKLPSAIFVFGNAANTWTSSVIQFQKGNFIVLGIKIQPLKCTWNTWRLHSAYQDIYTAWNTNLQVVTYRMPGIIRCANWGNAAPFKDPSIQGFTKTREFSAYWCTLRQHNGCHPKVEDIRFEISLSLISWKSDIISHAVRKYASWLPVHFLW